MADRQTATGDIGLVQAFVNTTDLQDGPEELEDPNTLQAWLVAKGLLDGSQAADASDLKNAIALREAIRDVIGGNSGSRIYPVDIATLNRAAVASGLRMRFGADGKARLEPESTWCRGRDGTHRGRAVRGHGRPGLDAAQAVHLANVPLGLLRPIQESLQPLVHHGFLRKPREGAPLQEPDQERASAPE